MSLMMIWTVCVCVSIFYVWTNWYFFFFSFIIILFQLMISIIETKPTSDLTLATKTSHNLTFVHSHHTNNQSKLNSHHCQSNHPLSNRLCMLAHLIPSKKKEKMGWIGWVVYPSNSDYMSINVYTYSTLEDSVKLFFWHDRYENAKYFFCWA